MKSVFILSFLFPLSSHAVTGAFLDESLYSAFSTVLDASGGAVTDVAWPGYRLLDANGVMRVLSDVTGPAEIGAQYSTSSQIVWSSGFRIQTRYADFGATCDLNNPSLNDEQMASLPSANYGNGLPLSNTYQSGHFSTCDSNSHFSQNNFSPIPLVTRAAWMYRTCRRIGGDASSAQITQMVERIRVPDPTPTPLPPSGGSSISAVKDPIGFGNTNPNLTYNWCNRISAPTESDYQSLFRAFYPGRNIPQIIDPTKSNLLLKSVSAPKAVRGSGSVSTSAALLSMSTLPRAQAQLLFSSGSQTPKFREKLMSLVQTSNAYIDGLGNSNSTGWPSLESTGCTQGYPSPTPTLEQVKAVAAWRALLITLCMDPGWQVL